MHAFSPLGVNWLEFHAQRIFNAVEFLQLNGFWKFYGYTIWDTCLDCSLEPSLWNDRIYFSSHSLNLLPYILINHFGGKELLFFIGPIFDKMMIFLCAVLLSEVLIISSNRLTKMPTLIVGIACFSIFVFSPWTYQMILAQWFEVYFLFFFLLGMFAFLNERSLLGYLAFFLAGSFHYQWAALIGLFYLFLIGAKMIFMNESKIGKYFPPNSQSTDRRLYIVVAFILPVCIFLLLRFYAQNYIGVGSGSSLISRIGISGNDIHNGGLLGALQFLGGVRITQCFQGQSIEIFSGNLENAIAFYNCIFSIAGMAIISIISVVGLYFFILKSYIGKQIFLPLLFALICMVTFLQQSLSVHLMGYSFIFSALFAIGILMLILILQQRISSSVLGLIFCFPIISGILILSIRVSMLSGIS
tara:strand:+ start:1470 stop:2714 length:1245 start_codon:yes stop_codon:yes gene_type:complete